MVKVFNKSNKPIGVAGKFVLPDKEIEVKDKDVYCAEFDEEGNDTGRKQILPALKKLEDMGFIKITEPVKEVKADQDEAAKKAAAAQKRKEAKERKAAEAAAKAAEAAE